MLVSPSQDVVFNEESYRQQELNRWRVFEKLEPAESPGYLIQSPIPVLACTFIYVLFVTIIGPLIMRNREPFQLKNVIRFYNLIMVVLALVLFIRLSRAVTSLGYFFDCDRVFNLSDGSSTSIYNLINFVLIVRICEYLDTVFFTLRKKQNQITFLHVFHHAFVPPYAYWVYRSAPTRFNAYIITINSFIHVCMYFYYFLATFQERTDTRRKPSFIMLVVNRLLVFKKYVTQLQILQFTSLGLYTIYYALRPNRCGIPWVYITSNFLLAFGFLALFLHFYRQVYKSRKATVDVNSKWKRS